MTEIASVERNGLSLVSTFSGCGGSCLGFRLAGFRTLFANEFVEIARETYRANAEPETIVDGRDIRSVTPSEILTAIGRSEGDVDVLEGSPPCSSFSTAGKRSKFWGKVAKYSETEQRTDDLFFEFIRILRGIRPRVFTAENVSGLIKGVSKGYFLEILRAFKESGYRVGCRILDAQWLGVPQARQRAIFIGVREDLGLEPVFPKPLSYRYSIRDAIPWLSDARITGRKGKHFERIGYEIDRPIGSVLVTDPKQTRYEIELRYRPVGKKARPRRLSTDEPSPTISAKGFGTGFASQARIVEPESSMERQATGREWERVSVGRQSEKYFQLVRPDPSEPCPTVTANGGNAGLASVCHPYEKRKFSIAELKRLSSFPDDFVLLGTYQQQWERIGRSVPPLMMFAIARTIRDEIFLRLTE